MTAPRTQGRRRHTARQEPGGQAGKLAFQRRHVLLGHVQADQAQVQVQSFGLIGALDPHGRDSRVTRPDQALGLKSAAAGAHCALGQAGVPDERARRRERARAIRPRVDVTEVALL
jgi:hypothetical protein